MVLLETYVILRLCIMAFSDHVILSNLGGVESHNLISILDVKIMNPKAYNILRTMIQTRLKS